MSPDPVFSETSGSARGRLAGRGRAVATLCGAAALVLFLTACSDIDFEGRMGPGSGDANLVFRIESASGGTADSDTAGNTLRADSLFLVVTQVEFKRDETDDCMDSTNVNDGDGCAELPIPPPDGNAVQPSVVVVPIGQRAETPAFPVPAGTYDEVQFDLHVLQMGEGVDDNILLNFQELQPGVSVRVDGRHNGEGFLFFGDLGTELEVPLEQAVGVGQGQTATITLTVDVLSWFRDPDTGTFFDPVEASLPPQGTTNPDFDPEREATVEANIEQSMEATGSIIG